MERVKPVNNLFSAMELVGYTVADILPAFPGKSADYARDVLLDNAWALSRPVVEYGLLSIHPCRTRHFNVTEHGFRSPGEEQPWPPHPDRPALFCFGGSTGLGTNVADGDAVPALLRRRLAPLGIEVYNFGSGNYSSRHEFLRFLGLLDHGRAPRWALFLDGFNDSFYALGNVDLINALDGLYQNEKRRRRMGVLAATWDYARAALAERRRTLPSAQSYRPSGGTEAMRNLLTPTVIEAALAVSDRPADAVPLGDTETALARMVWDRYLDSVAMIRAVAERHGVTPLFAWQPVPFFATRRSQRVMERLFTIFPAGAFTAPVYRWLAAHGFPGMGGDPDFLDLSRLGETTEAVSYVDVAHYSPPFAACIADALAAWLPDRLKAVRDPAAPLPVEIP